MIYYVESWYVCRDHVLLRNVIVCGLPCRILLCLWQNLGERRQRVCRRQFILDRIVGFVWSPFSQGVI